MQSSNEAWAHLEGQCANDDDYQFTPSGVRTKVALKGVPDATVALTTSFAHLALEELEKADEAYDAEEPTSEWLAGGDGLAGWMPQVAQLAMFQQQLAAVPTHEPAIELGTEVIELDPEDLIDDPDLLEEVWMLSEQQATPVPPEDDVSAWVAPPAGSLRLSTPDWSLHTWLTVAAAVLGGELIVMVALLV